MKPIHLFYPIVLFALGSVSMLNDGWMYFGLVMWLLGFVSTAWIVIVGFWSERVKYLDSLSDVLHEVRDVDFDKLSCLGLSPVSDLVRIDLLEGTRSRHFVLPVSPSKLKPLAVGLLAGRAFSERGWSNLLTSSEFRNLRSVMREKGLVVPISDLDPRQGFQLTQSGRDVLEQLLIPSPSGGSA